MSDSFFLNTYQARILEAWQEHCEDFLQYAQQDPVFESVRNIIGYYLAQPGKCLRPALFLLGYEMIGKKRTSKSIIDIALSLEFLHTYLLIHDDIMDQSDMRRHRKSLHCLFQDMHRQEKLTGDAARFGESMAILVGDMLASYAEKLWIDLPNTKLKQRAQDLFYTMKEEVYWGQYRDLLVSLKNRMPTYEEIKQIAETKTALYTIRRPLELGITLANEAIPDWVERYAYHTGILYQLTDDILGTCGAEEITGKSTLSDIDTRKITFLVYFAWQHGNKTEKEQLTRYFMQGREYINKETIRSLLTRAKPYAIKQAQDEYQQAIDTLAATTNSSIQTNLTQLALLILDREK